MNKVLAAISAVCAATLVCLAVAIPKSSVFYVELGDEVPSAPNDYLFGLLINNAEVDVSQVNSCEVGRYNAYAKFLFFSYTLNVEVRDTTPPVIELPNGTIYVAADREYEPADLVSNIYDLSGDVESTVTYDGNVYQSIRLIETGNYTAVIDSVDTYGNKSSREIEFTVDYAPMIIGAFDRHIEVGSDFDLTSVVAADSTDGILSDRIEINSGRFDPNTVGNYEVTYTVSDNYGLETSATVTLSVVEKKSLSEFNDEIRLTEPEVNLLCDLEYFSYSPLEEEDYDKTVEMIGPTLIDLKRFFKNDSWCSGSGCIYKITPEYIYFISVNHVTEEVSKDCNIMFFDGNVVSSEFEYVTSDEKNEASMFAIKTADIPADTLLMIRQIYFDPDIYSKLTIGDKVVAYATHWNGGSKDLIRPMKVRKLTSSIKSFGLVNSLLETTNNVISGMSGTAVVDCKGNLVGLASAVGPSTTDERSYSSYHSKVDVIPELWQKMGDILV